MGAETERNDYGMWQNRRSRESLVTNSRPLDPHIRRNRKEGPR